MTQEEIDALEAQKNAENPPQEGDGTNNGGDSKTPTVEELQKQLEKERKDRQAANQEAQKHRKELKELKDEKAKREEAEMSELEKAQNRIKQLEEQNQLALKQAREAMIMSTATKLGFVDPSDAVRLIDHQQLEDGAKAEDLLKELAKSKPYLTSKPEVKAPGGDRLNPGDTSKNTEDKEKRERASTLFPAINRLARR